MTAGLGEVREKPEAHFQHFIIEPAVLVVLIVALPLSLLLLRRRGAPAVADRA
jgi:hypothetical protein